MKKDGTTRRLVAALAMLLSTGAPAMAGKQYGATIVVDPPVICVGCTATVTVNAPSGETWCGSVLLPSNVCAADGSACDVATCQAYQQCPVIQQCTPSNGPEPAFCTGCPSQGCGPTCQQVDGTPPTTFQILGVSPGRGTLSGYGARYVYPNGSPLPSGEYCSREGGSDWWEDCAEVTVVGVASIKWREPVAETWEDTPNPLSVFKDTPVTFRAFPTPGDCAFPSGKPVWGGSSGASGSGDTVTVTLSTESSNCDDHKTVTASCSTPPKTVNALVYTLTRDFVPWDNFHGRSDDNYGLAEYVTLGLLAHPWCPVAPGAWINLGYPAKSLTPGGALFCAEVPCSHLLKYKITGGPSRGRGPVFGIGVVQPSGAWMLRDNSGNCPAVGEWRLHTGGGTASAGFVAWYFLEPRDVSFAMLQFREGSGPPSECVATGYWEERLNGKFSHVTGAWQRVWMGQATEISFGVGTGCYSGGHDEAGIGTAPPPWVTTDFAGGSITFPIPLEYKVGTRDPVQFDGAPFDASLGVTGTVDVYKKGLSETRQVSDPACPFPW